MYLMFQPLRKFLVVSGRARRKEYWLFFLFCFAAGVILPAIDMVAGTLDKESGFGLLIGWCCGNWARGHLLREG
jgi:uncharacterized membrane protein YhaH (DUF805 family)